MKRSPPEDSTKASEKTLLELYREETQTQTGILTRGLLELERGRGTAEQLEALMRAAHSLKGAARIVNLPGAVRVAHAMEDWFVAAQRGEVELRPAETDILLRGVDLLASIGNTESATTPSSLSATPPTTPLGPDALREGGEGDKRQEGGEGQLNCDVQDFLNALGALRGITSAQTVGPPSSLSPTPPSTPLTPGALREGGKKPAALSPQTPPSSGGATDVALSPSTPSPTALREGEVWRGRGRQGLEGGLGGEGDKRQEGGEGQLNDVSPGGGVGVGNVGEGGVLRLTAENLNRLLGLAGETLVAARWLRPFGEAMQRVKRMQTELERTLDAIKSKVQRPKSATLDIGLETLDIGLDQLYRQASEARQYLADRLQELDLFDRRSAHLSNRLYLEVLRARMRSFGDSESVRRFPRMVRDLARSLGKQVKLEIVGGNTQVDRDILDRLETPLNHLLRNAVDHGCETPEERERAGKPPEATIRLEARHSAGMLLVVVSDDGAGVDPGRVRQVITERKLTTPSLAEKLNESELLQFLFLPGFSVRETVTEISGRGVGLDIVQDMVKSVRGNVRVSSQPGRGMRFQLQLPLTLSVLRTLLVEVGGEPYAIPLAQIVRTLKLTRDRIAALEGRPHFNLGAERIGLLAAHQVLGCQAVKPPETELPIVVLGDQNPRYGLLVERFLGERELVVQPLDARLGKVEGISAAALMEDGAPVLIVDVDDLLRSIEKWIASGALAPPGGGNLSGFASPSKRRKRILAVDDSLTVRELERKLLINRGYLADVAVDGLEGWNAVRTGVYDLVITDVDMPRMDGIELATLIKRDAQLKSLPVMIVSYKDREEDRLRGLEAGADYYLTKGSFQDDSLLEAVVDLIGEPD